MQNLTFKYVLFSLLVLGLCDLRSRAAVYQETGGRIVIEAEHFHARTTNANTHHWHIVPDEDGQDFLADSGDTPHSNAREGKYMQVLPDDGVNFTTAASVGSDPVMDYKVFIQTPGTYRLFLRWAGHSGGSDSMYGQIVELRDGTGGSIADWYRYAGINQTDFAISGWAGNAGFERNDASGNDVAANWNITTPGVYTIRLSYREDGVTIDALILQLASLAAPGEPGPAESSTTLAFPPSLRSRSPNSGAAGVFPDTSFQVQLEDGGTTQVNTNSITLLLNGSPLTPSTISKSAEITTISAASAGLLPPASVNSLVISFSDTASTPQRFTNTWQFTVENYSTLTAELARPPGSVDTSSPGFTAFVHQARTAGDTLTLPNNTERAEDQLRGLLIDPTTGAPYVNHATPGTSGTTFIDPDVINWNQELSTGGTSVEIGNFQSPTFRDEPIPGIPGDENSNNNIAAEIITYLELSAGLHRLGVNSDDGFRVTSAINPRDRMGLQLGVFNGGRGAADTIFSVLVETSGIYPIRLIWYEGNGGANLEFFSVDPATGEKVLINDRANAKAIRAFRVSSASLPPIIQQLRPLPNAAGVNASTEIFVDLLDQDTRINPNSISLSLNANIVTPVISKTGAVTRVSFDPPGLLPSSSRNVVNLTFSDDGAPSRVVSNSWTFVVQNYSNFRVIPPAFKMPSGSVNLSTTGFVARVHQIDAARPGGNNLPAPEIQLTDGYGPNTAPAGPNPDGSYHDADVINWSEDWETQTAAEQRGFFEFPNFPDEEIPGIASGVDNNIVAEVLTFLELKAGIYRFIVNSDDGFLVTTAPNPRDTAGLRLGLFDGGRGEGDTGFDFIVEEAGFYPFRLLWWEGGGDASVEWSSIDATTGQRILINDRVNPRAVKAYRQGINKPYIKSISPAPGSAGVPRNTTIQISIVDGDNPVATNSIRLFLDEQQVNPVIDKPAGTNLTTVTYDPPADFAGQATVKVRLIFGDTAVPSTMATNEFSFVTERLAITLPALEQDANGLVVIEAENFDTNSAPGVHSWVFATTPAGYSGEGTMYALPETGAVNNYPDNLTLSPRLDYQVRFVKTGTHYAWFRGSDGGGDSLHMGIDGDSPDPTLQNMDEPDCCGTRLVPGGITLGWIGAIDLTPEGRAKFEVTTTGLHTITAWMREDGQIIDKLLITTDPTFIPSGGGPPESSRVGGVTPPPQFNPPVIQAGNVVLSWTGTGTLEQADVITGPWTTAPNQTNPQNVPTTGPMKFYRLKR